MQKKVVLVLLFIMYLNLQAIGLDLYSSPSTIASAEVSLLSQNPATAYYQPAKINNGFSISHSNPYGFSEINIIHLATVYKNFSLGSFILDNQYISDKTFYLGYGTKINDFSIGSNLRLYTQSIDGYNELNAFTANLGFIWQNNIFTHGLTLCNLTHTKVDKINLPSIFKYECMISAIEKTDFAFSFEKENNYEMRYAFAISQMFADMLKITTGFLNNPSQFSAGLNIFINNIEIEYATRSHNELSFTHAVGITYKL